MTSSTAPLSVEKHVEFEKTYGIQSCSSPAAPRRGSCAATRPGTTRSAPSAGRRSTFACASSTTPAAISHPGRKVRWSSAAASSRRRTGRDRTRSCRYLRMDSGTAISPGATRRLRLHHRPQEGHHHQGGRQHRLARDHELSARASRRGRRRHARVPDDIYGEVPVGFAALRPGGPRGTRRCLRTAAASSRRSRRRRPSSWSTPSRRRQRQDRPRHAGGDLAEAGAPLCDIRATD